MITNAYNKTVEPFFTDNDAVVQGVLSKNTHMATTEPLSTFHSSSVSSFAKTLKPSKPSRDENPITEEVLSDGLGSLFAAATGLDCFNIIMDLGSDAVDFYDQYVQDRPRHLQPKPACQPDPRVWMQPQPGFAVAA
ncbi:MAG: hypothetical protein H6855_04945 [Rhodospirillales bacterium]|nr:hypothetical protein [Rhodospirillales bacterium]